MKKVLIINVGWEQEPFVKRLSDLGHCIFAINSSPIDGRLACYFKDSLVCDYFDITKIISYSYNNAIDAVISDQCDYAMYAQSCVATALKIPGPSIASALKCTNKITQRSELNKKNLKVQQPIYKNIFSPKEAADFFNEVGAVVIKPADSRGSFGVSVVERLEDIDTAYWSALSNSSGRQVIIEQRITGTEYTVDGYCFNGVASTIGIGEKLKHPNKPQVAMGIRYQIEKLDTELYKRLNDASVEVAEQLELTFGFTHAEFLVTEEGNIYLVEMANRGGGCWTSAVVDSLVSGIDMVDTLIADVLGDDSYSIETKERFSTELRFFNLDMIGSVRKITGWNCILDNENVLAGRLNFGVDSELLAVTNDASRHGFIIYKTDARGPEQLFEELLSKLQVDMN